MDERLKNCDKKNTEPFLPQIECGKVIYVVDGDTFDVACILKGHQCPKSFRIRMKGIDSPEIRSSNMNVRKMAFECKEALEKLLLNKMVRLENISWGVFGHRLVSDVFLETLNVCEHLLKNRRAIVYKGKRDKNFNWEKYVGDYEKEYKEKIQLIQDNTTHLYKTS